MPLFFSGRLVSLLGSALYTYALSLFVLKTTGSALSFAGTMIFGTVPSILLSPFAGVLADRFHRKTVIVAADLLCGLTVLGLFLYSSLLPLSLASVYLTAFLLSTFDTFFAVSMSSSIPNLFDDSKLTRANSVSNGIESFSNILGPIIGGLIFALVDIRLFLLINGLSFLLSAFAELFLDFGSTQSNRGTAQQGAKGLSAGGIMADLRDSIRYVKTQRVIMLLMLFLSFLNFFIMFGVEVPGPYMINDVIGLSPTQYGFISGICSFGVLAGSLLLSVLPEVKNHHRAFTLSFSGLTVSIALCGLPYLLRALSPTFHFVFYLVDYAAFGLFVVFANVPLQTMLQRAVTDEQRGRVFGVLKTISSAMIPLGFLLSGLLVDKIPTYFITFGAGAFLILMIIIFCRSKELAKI